MNYLDFQKHFIPFQVFSIQDIKKVFPVFDSRRLSEWCDKGYLEKIINKWYRFKEIPLDEFFQFRISNCICHPSYLSLSTALSWHRLIPEAVYTQQAVTTRKTTTYDTTSGKFEYRSLKPSLYFGYEIVHGGTLPVLIAEKEKALLDYCYLTFSLKSLEDIKAVRLNLAELKNIDWEKLQNYAVVFNSQVLNKRIAWIKKLLPDDFAA